METSESAEPVPRTGKRKRLLVIATVGIAAAVVAASLYAFVLAPGAPGGDGTTAGDAMLFYDPTGGNYAPGTRGGGSAKAFLVEDYRGQPKVREVFVDGDRPIAAVGSARLSQTAEGAWQVDSFAPKPAQAATQGDLASDPLPFEFANVEVDVNAVGVVYGNRTFGLGIGQDRDFVFVSPERKPTFFTNVRLTGVVLRPTFLDALELFAFDVPQDLARFRADLDIPTTADAPAFVFADRVEYRDVRPLEGDVHDVVLPEEVAALGLSLLGADVNSDGARFLLNVTRNVDEVLVSMGETDNTLQSLDHWFVLGTRNLTYEEMRGLVTLNVAESDFSAVQARLGLSFDAPTDLSWRVHVGVTADADPAAAAYSRKEVRDLWTALGGTHAVPPVAAVEVNAFALVLDYRNVAEYLGTALGLDADTMAKLRAIAEFRNPAMALLFDRNLTDSLATPTEPFWDYAGIAFLRDFPSTQDLLYYLNVKGELYDSWMFLGVSPPGLSSIPVLIADSHADATEGIVSGHLWDLYANATSGSTLVVETDGFAVGTTVKTVLNYTQFRNFVKYLPVDVGAYDVHDKAPGTFYHVPVFYPTWGTGPTYVGTHVTIKALFVRGQPQRDRLASFLVPFLGQDAVPAAFGDLVGNVTLDNPFVKMLDGYFLAFSVRKAPVPTTLVLASLTAADLVHEGSGGVNVDATAVVSRRGQWLDFNAIVVRFVVTTPSGRVYAEDTASLTLGLLDTPVSPFPPISLDPPEAGVHRVDAYLMKLEEFGREIDARSTTFRLTVVGPPDHLDVTHTASAPQEAGLPFSVTVRVLDAQGSVVTRYAGTVTFSSSDPNAGLPGSYTFVPAVDRGSHTFFAVVLRTAGTQTVTIQATGVASPAFAFSVDVTPNQSPLLWILEYVSGDGQSAPRGSPLPAPFVVRVTDGFGNVLQGAEIDWAITFEPYPPPNQGSLSATITFSDAAGEASVTLTLGTGLFSGVYIVRAYLSMKPIAEVFFTATAV